MIDLVRGNFLLIESGTFLDAKISIDNIGTDSIMVTIQMWLDHFLGSFITEIPDFSLKRTKSYFETLVWYYMVYIIWSKLNGEYGLGHMIWLNLRICSFCGPSNNHNVWSNRYWCVPLTSPMKVTLWKVLNHLNYCWPIGGVISIPNPKSRFIPDL